MITYPHPPLSDGTILLRPWMMRDLPAVEQASHDPYIPAITSVPAAYTHAEGLRWIEQQQQRVSSGMGLPFCIADAQTDDPLEFIGLWLDHLSQGRARFGYWMIPPASGRGVASAALRLISAWTFEALPVVRLELMIEPWNIASQQVAARAGFVQDRMFFTNTISRSQ